MRWFKDAANLTLKHFHSSFRQLNENTIVDLE